jgi:hypothetical protein
MADEPSGTVAPAESPENRLRGAGFANELGYWREPNGERLFGLEDAIAGLDSGEIQPGRTDWPGVHPEAPVHVRSEEEIDRMLGRNQPEPVPLPMPSWAQPWSELIAEQLVEKLGPVIRRECRAAIREAERKRKATP